MLSPETSLLSLSGNLFLGLIPIYDIGCPLKIVIASLISECGSEIKCLK